MSDPQQSGSEMIAFVAERLGDLRDRVVFVGGAVTGLLITNPAARPARFTEDVDVVVQVATYTEYVTRLGEELRRKGFSESSVAGDPICRWRIEGAVVDIMPTEGNILGFSNRWYAMVVQTATERLLRSDLRVRLVAAPCFIATKIEAFRDRGQGDYLGSRDIEDIISVIDGRAELVAEIAVASPDLRDYLAEAFRILMNDDDFLDALPGHLYSDAASQARVTLIEERMLAISQTK